MGWYPIQFVVWCIELVVIYDALMFFTKNWNVKHRAMFFFCIICFNYCPIDSKYDQGISIIQLNPFACLREIYYGSGQSGSYSHLILILYVYAMGEWTAYFIK